MRWLDILGARLAMRSRDRGLPQGRPGGGGAIERSEGERAASILRQREISQPIERLLQGVRPG